MNVRNTMNLGKLIMNTFIGPNDTAVDCTVGNGNDTVRLAELVGPGGMVYGFDIQTEALINTRKKLNEKGLLDRTKLYQQGHEDIDLFIDKNVDFFVYNLGYLPGGNKDVITKGETTLISLQKAINLLGLNGHILILSYIGHSGGLEEQEAIYKFLMDLDQKYYSVFESNFINQINNPPRLYVIEKIKEKVND